MVKLVELINGDFTEYDNFIKEQDNGHILQTSNWSNIKEQWDFNAFAVRDSYGSIACSMGLLIRKQPVLRYSIAYAPRGPVFNASHIDCLYELLLGVMEFCRKQKCCTLICDPYIKVNHDMFSTVAAKMGFKLFKSKNKFNNIQPQFVYTLDIAGKTEEQLLSSFDAKARYNLRLAQRKGVNVSVCDLSHLEDFYKLMIITGERDNFKVRPKAYFERLLTELGENARLYMAYYDGVAVAGTIAHHYGNKTTYLYGVSSNSYRNVMPNYLLQWEMMKWGLETKSSIYDFGGVPGNLDKSNPLYGLYKFKKGFNGELTELIGEFRYDFIPFVYPLEKFALKILKKFLRANNKINHRHVEEQRQNM